jgi:hypothetical protein
MIAGINAGLIYANGCVPFWTSATVMGVSAGQLRNSTDVNDIEVDEALTITSTVVGAGGLDVGTMANTTLYAVYVIAASTLRVEPAAILSLSESAPLLPRDYDMYLKVGHVRTDGSAQFLPFVCVGNGLVRETRYDTPIAVLTAGAATSFTDVDCADIVPAMETKIFLQASITPNSAGNSVFARRNGSAASSGNAQLSGAVSAVAQLAQLEVTCDEDAVFEYKVSNASDATTLSVIGYQEILGL